MTFFNSITLTSSLARQSHLCRSKIHFHLAVNQSRGRFLCAEMLLALLYPLILGLERIETTQLLPQNGVFQCLIPSLES